MSINREEDIKTVDIFLHLIQNIKVILFITFTLTILTISFYIFFANEKYTANSIVQKTVYSPGSQANSSSPLSSLASLGGFSVSDGSEGEKVIVKKIQTRKFFNELISLNPSYSEIIYAASKYDMKNNNLEYDASIFNAKTNKWNKDVNYQTIHEKFLKSLSIKYNLDDSLIYISYEHISPFFASEIINEIISLYNEQHKDKEIEESNEAVDFLTNKLAATEDPYVRDYIASLVQNHYQQNMFASIRPAISFIETPYVPDNKSSFGILFYSILGILIGLVFGSIYVLLKKNVDQFEK